MQTVEFAPQGVLCVHGLTGSPDELAPLVAVLKEAGFVVQAPLLPGHGRDAATLAASSAVEWERAVDQAVTDLVRESGGPIVIVGGSAGGLLAITVAARRPADICGLVFCGTPLSLPALASFRIRLSLMLPARLRPRGWSEVAKPDGPNVSDRAVAAGLRSLPVYPIRALGELLVLMRDARSAAARITQPVLVAHGDLDATVSRAQVEQLVASLHNAERIERLALPNSAHLIGVDRDRAQLAAAVIQFILRLRSSATPATAPAP